MKRSLVDALPNQIAELFGRALASHRSSSQLSPHCSASQKLEFIKPNMRAMRIMSRSRNDRGPRELW